jgi:hypothetical protein
VAGPQEQSLAERLVLPGALYDESTEIGSALHLAARLGLADFHEISLPCSSS